MYKKREKIKLCCSPQLKKKQPLFLIINTWVLCRAWWNDVKNTVVHCYSCQKSFGLDRIQQGDLDLTSSGSQQKTMISKRFLQELTWRHYYSSIFCSKYQTLCCWCVRVADLYKLKLCTFLWPLSCITKFPGTPVSSRQETDILQIEWFIFLFWAAKPAVFAAVDMNFPISFLPGGEHLYHVALWHQVWWLTAR